MKTSTNVAAVILGGGEGSRLFPLTRTRCKPAMEFGGKYRLVDVPISHAVHAGCHKVFVLTQFLSSSLHHHIFQTYAHSHSPLVEILAADQRHGRKEWFEGTADAVRKNLEHLLETPADYFLILSGDQLYNMNFHEMFTFAQTTSADVVVATLPVGEKEASRMGVVKVDPSSHRIIDFCEKPKEPALLKEFKTSRPVKEFLGSMGIYLFKRKALADLLTEEGSDFGQHLIPSHVKNKGSIAAYLYEGYWEDIGTVSSFYEANIALTRAEAPFSFDHPLRPIFNHRLALPPTRVVGTRLKESLLCDGSLIEAKSLTNTIVGPRSVIGKGCDIRGCYLMGNDYYKGRELEHHQLPLNPQIGDNCILDRVIVDKNVHIGNRVVLKNLNHLAHYDSDHLFVREGVMIVPRGATLPDGFTF